MFEKKILEKLRSKEEEIVITKLGRQSLKNNALLRNVAKNIFAFMLVVALAMVVLPTKSEASTIAPKDQISGGRGHTLSLKSDGTVWAWGSNSFGQLGDGTTTEHLMAVQVMGLTDVVQVSAGDFYSLARKSDGTVWAWGKNWFGQIGNGTTVNELVPVQVLTNAIAIAGGSNHSLALKSDGTVWAWGLNNYGQLGDGTITNRTIPVKVANLTGVIAIASHPSSSLSLALKSDGTVWGWGANYQLQLDNSTYNSKIYPFKLGGINGLSGVTAIATNGYNMAFLKSDGTLWIGSGNGANKINGLSNITSFSLGSESYLALESDGSVWTWGYNSYGELGNGTTSNNFTPAKVMTGASAIAGAHFHSLAMKSDGTVVTWGYNDMGQLGNGTKINCLSPTNLNFTLSATDPALQNATSAVVKAETDISGSLATQSLVDIAKTDYNTALNLVNALSNSTDKTNLLVRLTAVQQTITNAQNVLNATNAVTTANTLSNGDLSTQALIVASNKAISDAQALVTNLPDGNVKTSLQNSLNTDSSLVSLAQSNLNATNAVTSANTLSNGDLSTQALIDASNKAISDAQALVTNLPDGNVKTSLQQILNTNIATVKLAQDTLNATNAVNNVGTLVSGDLTTQTAIDVSNKAISDAQVLVTALPVGTVKDSLQIQLTVDSVKVLSAQDILNAKNAVANATTVVNGDLSTQVAIDASKQTIADAQTLVNKLPVGDIKTALQNQINDATAKIQLAQDILNAKNAVASATTASNGDLTTQLTIDTANQAIVVAQPLVDKLPISDIKTSLQSQLTDASSKVQLAQDVLNAKNAVASATTASNADLTTQLNIDTTNQAIANAQVLVNKLPIGAIKTGLQSDLDANTLKANTAQATLDVKTSEQTKAQSDVDKANVSILKLPEGAVKTSLTQRNAIVQKYININNALDSVLNGVQTTYDALDVNVIALNIAKASKDTYPVGVDKDTLTTKYQQGFNLTGKSFVTLMNPPITIKKDGNIQFGGISVNKSTDGITVTGSTYGTGSIEIGKDHKIVITPPVQLTDNSLDFFVRYADQEVKAQVQAKLDLMNKHNKMELKDINPMQMRAFVMGYILKNVNVHATPKRVEDMVNKYYPMPHNPFGNWGVNEDNIEKWSNIFGK